MMSTIDLMLLGVLMSRPTNAYEMKKEMEFRNIQDWVKISSPSVYKNLVKLYKQGYVDGEIVREGEMPEKTVYSINEKGRKYFLSLMQRYSGDPGKIFLEFCAFLANLPNVEYAAGLEMIQALQESLALKKEHIDDQLERMENVSFYATSVIDLYSRMYSVFCDWIQDFKKQYEERRPG